MTIQKGRYRHFKGNDYEVIDIAKHSETQEDYVVYRALYGKQEHGEQGLWIRPAAMFAETIERDGKTMPRFHFLGSDTDSNTAKKT